jgi:hypothetical protein
MERQLIFNFVQRLFILFLFFQSWGIGHAEEKLFENNQWRAVIVIPDNPEINEWYAARSLSDWAQIITGKKIALLSESESLTTNLWKINIGKTHACLENKLGLFPGSGDRTARVIKEKSIYLIGSNPGATRIAVGRFCEQAFAITFCQPGIQGADYTLQKEITVPAADFFEPAYHWRAVGGLSNELSKDWAYSVGYGDYPAFSHNFYKIFTENEWQKDPLFSPQENKAT